MSNPIVGNLEIIGIRDAGNIEKERLLLRAIYPVGPEYYIVVNVKQGTSDKLTILNDKVFWFPSGYQINAGEFIRLYTKKGKYSKEESKFGDQPAVYHNFYWDLENAVWDGQNSDAVTILKVEGWNSIRQNK